MHHPWRAFRDLVEWTLLWAHLPVGVLGVTDFDKRTVTLKIGLNQAERRSTIAHETQHILRGPVAATRYEAADERFVCAAASRQLIAFDALVDAMVWAYDEHELAHELWVDVGTVRDRLAALTPGESAELSRRMLDAELRYP